MPSLNWALNRLDDLKGPNPKGWYSARCPCCDHQALSIGKGYARAFTHRCWRCRCTRERLIEALRRRERPSKRIVCVHGRLYFKRDVSQWLIPVLRMTAAEARERAAQQATDDAAAKAAYAREIWSQCKPASGTLAERYLRNRNITIALPPTIGFHPNLRHPSGVTVPCLVVLVQDVEGKALGIQRTWLQEPGRKLDVEPNKVSLGAIAAGAVHLAEAAEIMAVAEGVESGLSFLQGSGIATWVGLGGGLVGLALPPLCRTVYLAVDGDDAGDAYARALAARYIREGRQVLRPQAPRGWDFNDMLVKEAR